jgi:hypothetical protein
MWEPRRLTNLWASTACYRDSFTFFFYLYLILKLFLQATYKLLNSEREVSTLKILHSFEQDLL